MHVNRSYEVSETDVAEILRGHRTYPGQTSLGSRIEAVRRLDARPGPRLSGDEVAALLGVNRRTVERYRRKIRTDSLG